MFSSDIRVWDTLNHPYNYNDLIRDIYFKKKKKLRKNFNEWIGQISKGFKNDIDWWVNIIGERNNLNSDLFHYLCILETLKELKKKKIYIKNIEINNDNFKSIILKKKFLVKNIIIKNETKRSTIKVITIIFYRVYIFILAKIYKKSIYSRISIVDYFLVENNLSTKRYYGDLENKIKNKNVFFIPTIVNTNVRDLISLTKKIKLKKNSFLKESFISVNYFLESIFYFSRLKKFNRKYNKLLEYDFTQLILDELKCLKNYNTIIIALNNYFFFKSLKEKKFEIKTSINWFENTAIDKGWNFGLNRFFKKANSFGYQGFTCYKDFLCLDPVKHEARYQLIPKKIVIIGKKYLKPKIEFYKKLKILQGFAYRFSYLSENYFKEKKLILVSLNLDKKINKDIINIVNQSQFLKKKKVVFKIHPALKFREKDLIDKKHFISNEPFKDLIKKSKVFITAGTSSTMVESICNGVPVVIPFKDDMTEFSLKSINSPRQLYKVCKNEKNFDKTLSYLLKKNSIYSLKKLNKIKNNYFNLHKSHKLIDFRELF